MTLRSPAIAALAVLLVMIGAAFILTSEAGVNTDVQNAIPTATPLPDPSAANWQETQPGSGQYQYIGNTQSMVLLNVQYSLFDEFIATNALTAPADDVEAPLLDIMIELHDDIQQSVVDSELETAPDLTIGPLVESFAGVPVTLMRLTVPAQTAVSGQPFPGAELILAWVLQDGQLARVEVQYQGVSEPMIYLDFRAWLEDNIPAVVEQAQANAAEAAAAAEDAAPQSDDTDADDAGDDAPADGAGDEAPADDAGDEDISAAPVEPTGPWLEVMPGMYQHVTLPENTLLGIDPFSLEELALGIGFIPEEGEAITALDIMEFQAGLIQTQFDAANGQFEPGPIEGPTELEVAGVPLITLAFTITTSDGVTANNQYTYLALIPVGDTHVNAITVQYIYEGEPDQQIFNDYDTWLSENIAALTTLPEDALVPPVDETAPAEDDGAADDSADAPAADDADAPADDAPADDEDTETSGDDE